MLSESDADHKMSQGRVVCLALMEETKMEYRDNYDNIVLGPDSDTHCARCHEPISEAECYEFADENEEPICGDCYFVDSPDVDQIPFDTEDELEGELE